VGGYDAAVATDRLRETWDRDEPAFNAWLTLEGRAVAEAVAAAGFDAVTLDLQHGAATLDGHGAETFAVVESAGGVPFVRTRWNDPAEIMRALDLGARGIICPMVGSRAEAERLVGWCRYPPEGVRSFGPVRGALGSGAEHVRRANESVVVLAMIETADGLRNAEEIASAPGLDGLYVGPTDLSLALGLSALADLDDPSLLEALDAVVGAARRNGIVPGVHAPRPDRAASMVERGFRFVCPAVDADLVRSGAEAALEATRARLRV
jgi:4-hydroxy-2-oxoheptanedioate aldolase